MFSTCGHGNKPAVVIPARSMTPVASSYPPVDILERDQESECSLDRCHYTKLRAAAALDKRLELFAIAIELTGRYGESVEHASETVPAPSYGIIIGILDNKQIDRQPALVVVDVISRTH